jgi:peptide/nickel transport system ATP-binding protein
MTLTVHDLTVRIGSVTAVHGITLQLHPGQRTGLIGESGSGKTLTALAMIGLLPEGVTASGRVVYGEADLMRLSERELCRIRGDRLAMIFQEPMTALNPVMKIGDQVAEPLQLHRGMSPRQARTEAGRLLERVGLSIDRLRSYPHQLSGGQRQRAMIAMAMACSPEILIADEPTTALDVTVQAQILDLLMALVDERRAALLLITHDLAVVANVCQRVLVLYGGRVVEEGSVDQVFTAPRHPYTQALLDAIPPLDDDLPTRKLRAIAGAVPGLGQFPPGCPFRNRCPRADSACEVMPPLQSLPLDEVGSASRTVACWHPLA